MRAFYLAIVGGGGPVNLVLLERMLTQKPMLWAYLLAAMVGAIVYANLRAIGAMLLNGELTLEHAAIVYRRVDFVPLTALQALGWFVIVGVPAFLFLRKRNGLKWWAFALLGAVLGAVASPALLVPEWTVMSASAGALAACFAFALVHAL